LTRCAFDSGTSLIGCAVALMILGRDRRLATKGKRALTDLRAFRKLPFALFAIALFFGELAFYIPPFYIPSYALHSLHASEDFSFYVLAIANAGSCVGRTAPSLMGQRIGAMQTLIFFMSAAVVAYSCGLASTKSLVSSRSVFSGVSFRVC
jgi:predicted MFS family arabinose efflux permease